jgi:hypothetical protein
MCDIRHENLSCRLLANIVIGVRSFSGRALGSAAAVQRSADRQLHNSLAGGKVEQGGIDDVLLEAPPLEPDAPLDPDPPLVPDPALDP